ncbi:MAG: SecDF P1 head subdomain-containing protein [Verrucomicrobiota bacterium]
MRTRPGPFNLFLWLGLGLVVAACASTPEEKAARKAAKEREKQASSLRLHLQTAPETMGSGKVRVLRSEPVTLNVEKDAFVDEGFIKRAQVVETVGGHAIRVEFTDRGALRLQMATANHPGQQVAVWARWTEGRWLAAPVIRRAIENGIFQFTPDATREEADRIVLGLNNVALELGNQPKPEKAERKRADKEQRWEDGKRSRSSKESEMFGK